MATLGADVLTFSDIAKRLEPDNKTVADVINTLSQENDILKFLPWMQGNLATGHRTTVLTGRPTVGLRRINQGVPTSKSTTKQVDEGACVLEGWSEVDTLLLELGGNESAIRAQEAKTILETMNETFSTNFFYADPSLVPDAMLGITPRYNSLSGEYGNSIIDGGGSGSDNTSIWLVGLGDRGLHGIYPLHSNAGISHTDHGTRIISDSNGNRTVKSANFQWKTGLAVKDWRRLIRIANIDVSDLATYGSGGDTSANLLNLLVQATNRVPGSRHSDDLKYVILANETTITWCDLMVFNKANGAFGLKEIDGQAFSTFRGIPVLKCDALSDAESTVS